MVAQMEEVAERYPYFQLLHTLIAKAKHDQQTADAYAALGHAAIYAPDRRLLRRVLYDALVVAIPEPDKPEEFSQNRAATPTTPAPHILPVDTTEPTATEDVAESTSKDEEAATSVEHTLEQGTEEEGSDSLRDELAKTLEDLRASKEQAVESHPVEKEEPESAVSNTDVPRTDVPRTDVPRTRQQEIIDRFVAANPQINRDTSIEENASDLSAPSSAFQDDLVTENLAEIMLKQGKTDKAMDLYEKLVLKYPEKKAYFAQKIEQLKNN